MSVTIGQSTKTAPVRRFLPLKSGDLTTDGSEQTLVEYAGLGKVSGYVDLSAMQLGDIVEVKQYIMVDSSYQKYADEVYENLQTVPVIYVTPKETDKGLKVTLQQITGVLRRYHNRFILEE